MKYILLTVFFVTVAFRCAPPKNSQTIIGAGEPAIIETPKIEGEIIETPPPIPPGAVSANFLNDHVPFYAKVKSVDKQRGKTTINFEKITVPEIVIPEETFGASLSSLRFTEFDRDLLLVNAKLKDPGFNKYFVYILKNNQWKQVVSAFAIHKDNQPDTLQPIKVNPLNELELTRYYSVFNLDQASSSGYTWRLLTETIPILNK